MLPQIFTNETVSVLGSLFKFYNARVTLEQISEDTNLDTSTVERGLENALQFGYAQVIEKDGTKYYTLYNDRVNDALKECINIALDYKEKRF
jgi:predicted transcriptional regulator